ncbi:hypothetical protein GA0061105_101686 [Rhizobium aethiopicum]|uniref:DUF7256 domain-containing protein n=1 Tax=Rhizobium aethiopicum TaxID=1138170 RepID=A0A1C3XX68_9HYPH|nr:hypothetical protein GA0061105_101686 [Rhizobium aethiopicum]
MPTPSPKFTSSISWIAENSSEVGADTGALVDCWRGPGCARKCSWSARNGGSNENVDIAALGDMRPGMPVASVEAAMASAWKTPAPNNCGKIGPLEKSHRFVLWIDRNGLIGW